jgi:hypothetical protein
MMEKRNAWRLWVGKPEGRIPLGRPRGSGCIIIREIGWDDVDLIDLA